MIIKSVYVHTRTPVIWFGSVVVDRLVTDEITVEDQVARILC